MAGTNAHFSVVESEAHHSMSTDRDRRAYDNGPGSAEFRFLLLCACPRHSDDFAQRARALLYDGFDWESVVREALRHRVVPLLNVNMRRLHDPRVPGDLMAALASYCSEIGARNRLLATELVELLSDLERHGIGAIPFKGPVLAEEAYGDLSLRMFADLDFLIRESDITPAMEVLHHRGYVEHGTQAAKHAAAIRNYAGQVLMVRRDRSVWIEPHFRLTQSTFALQTDYAGLWARARRRCLAGHSILTLAPEDHLIALSVHGSKEEWLRLNWISDVAALIGAHQNLDWDVVLKRAGRERCLRMVMTALGLASRVLNVALPHQVSRRVWQDPDIQRITTWACDRLQSGRIRRGDGVSAFRYTVHDTAADRIRYAWRTIVTPTAKHYAMVDLPKSLTFGYYPIKLAHDYAMLPVWLAYKKLSGRR